MHVINIRALYMLIIKALVIYCQIVNLVPFQDNECSDPNSELRFDSPECVLTCNKRSIFDDVNPASCFQNHTLQVGCYCKQGYYLEEEAQKCVNFQDCPCNATNKEVSRFSNDCGNNCETFHTLTRCHNELRSHVGAICYIVKMPMELVF